MKKIKTVFTAIVMLLSATAFAAGPEKVTPVVKAAFANDFSTATQVNWEKSNDFYFASFTLNDVKVDAAYTEAGELVGTARKILIDQAPLSVSLAISEKFAKYTIDKSVIELTFEGVTRYYVNVENEVESLKLKCYNNGELEVDRKTKK